MTDGPRTDATVLVVAKAPEPGRVKTRLATDVGEQAAAEIAAAALLDTLAAVRAVTGHRQLALSGDLDRAVRGNEIRASLDGWSVTPQCGSGLGERLAHAHALVKGPVVQIGMDTPQVTAQQLAEAAAGLTNADAVLSPAVDGGWWALALRDPAKATVLTQVPMSTPTTCDETHHALRRAGLSVAIGERLRDVDHVTDLGPVAAAAPTSRFAQTVATQAPSR